MKIPKKVFQAEVMDSGNIEYYLDEDCDIEKVLKFPKWLSDAIKEAIGNAYRDGSIAAQSKIREALDIRGD